MIDSTTPVLVDTDVISYLFKSHPLAVTYQAILAGRSLAISVVTVAEIEYGMEAKNWGIARRGLMHRFLARFTVLSPDEGTARLWAQVKRGCERVGRPITFADAWIAASALQLNLPLATNNVRDFSAVEKLIILSASSK